MTIRTYQSFSGYVATEPGTEPTRDGTPRFYARAGQRQGRKEPDGTFTKLPTQYMPIVAYGEAAEEAAALLGKGDSFTAEGRTRLVKYERDGKTIEGEEFEVWKIGRRASGAERSAQAEHAIAADAPAQKTRRTPDVPPTFASPATSRQSPAALAL
ncbi:single-stranded DNA-binding protein [Rathayibacter soli]|uniref:single-stranded DNA-binding protein n=1 Tax=Rathayibacter soli TaxID=3144168 RepID=UPI0027E46665|nr:single-stranded DNA-binding protein [Glaciibacter superstes]